MNNGRICVSVCAKTGDDLLKKLERARNSADVIEIRFDCLETIDCDELRTNLGEFRKEFKGKLLATYRAAEQGGKNRLSFESREDFWQRSWVAEIADWADLEEDISLAKIRNSSGTNGFQKIIRSSHHFEKVPENLPRIYDRLISTGADIVKIAIQSDDITDSIPIWQLMNRARSENQDMIPIAMGEAGKWTRILGLANGAFLTYASLDTDKETAPGQLTANELTEIYRIKELNRDTDVYAIIGSNTSVSLSPLIHNSTFKAHKLNAVFVPFQVDKLDEFMTRMVKPETREIDLNLKGLAVTIPHKRSIIKHLDFLDDTAEEIGAVNTIKIVDGKLWGFNTDAQGFIEPLKKTFGDLRSAKVAILGAGGASRSCCFALERESANVTVFDGSDVRNKNFKTKSFSGFDLVINTTPLGMRGKFEGQTPLTAEQIKGVKLIYDLVYTPFQTQLMNEADKVDIPKIGGMAMLIAQALEQQKIWTGLEPPSNEISVEVLKRLK